MGKFGFFDEDRSEGRSRETSTIPRQVRMGSTASSPALVSKVAPTNTREANRFVPHRNKTFLVIGNGKKLDARIINMSSLSVAVEADFSAVPPTDVTMVGSHKVKAGRTITRGAVFILLKPIAPERCNETFVI